MVSSEALYLIFIFQNLPESPNCSSRSVIRRIIGFDSSIHSSKISSKILNISGFAVIYPFCISDVKTQAYLMTKPYTEKDQIFFSALNLTVIILSIIIIIIIVEGSTHRRQSDYNSFSYIRFRIAAQTYNMVNTSMEHSFRMHGQDTARGITFRLDHKPQMSVFVPTFFQSAETKAASISYPPRRGILSLLSMQNFAMASLRQSSYINITTENWLSKISGLPCVCNNYRIPVQIFHTLPRVFLPLMEASAYILLPSPQSLFPEDFSDL